MVNYAWWDHKSTQTTPVPVGKYTCGWGERQKLSELPATN